LFTELERKTKEFIEKQDSIKDKKRRIRDVELGFTRLLWQIATWNGTASRNRLENKYTQYPTEIIGNTVNTISGPAWGLAQAPELTAELIASAMQTKGSSLVMGPFRGLLNLVKVWDRTDSSVKHDVADLLTSLEDFSTTYSSHFSDGFADIDFDSTGGIYRRIWDLEPEDESKLSSAANFARKTGQIAVIASGINDNTNLTRFYAKGRFIRLMREQIYSGKLKKFLQLRESSKAEMSALLADSYYNVSSERLLWKKHKSLARQAGLNPFLALQCVRCGLDTVESLETLVWGLNHIKAVDNKVDFRDLRLAHAELLEMNNPPVDPALYLKTITEFNVGIERMIRKKSVTSEYGLNKVLGDAERSSAHRWINKLTNYMRTWFDDRMLSIPETGVTKLVISSVITLGTLELAITLLREWIQGRAMEDIITEIEEDPWKYIIRFITRLPLFGTFSPMFEGLISFVAGATGVTSPRNKNTGLQQGLSASVMQLSVGGPAIGANVIQGGVRRIKDIGETYGLSVLGMPFNSSIYALPVRLLESRELFEKQSAMQFIIDGMQKKEYPYMERGRSSNTPKSGNVPIPAVDYPVSKLNMQDPKVKEMSYPGYKPNIEKPKQQPNTGVSGILGDLLKDLN
jgi:hypothetical protein